ncbi:MAG: zinc ABC transporter substrate-binding protein [Candidatus Paceibacterota bacterium]|jgi:zinc transport system substrate-binding protein
MKKNIIIPVIILVVVIGAVFFGLSFKKDGQIKENKISIVSTLYPLYDFAKEIGGDNVNVTLLLPPGVEAHAYEPKPSDIVKINSTQIFIYTGEFMEPWAHDIIESVDKKVKVVDASTGIEMMEEGDYKHEEEHEHEEADHHESEEAHHHGGVDPHIWLDFNNAKIMAENITKALVEIDPQNAEYYQNNLESYQIKLTELDDTYKNTLSVCKSKTIIYGGHYAFGYLAKRYGLEYVSAQGFSPDAEPTAKDLIDLVDQIKKSNIKYVFYEELTTPKIAETLANETEAKMLLLNAAHNLTKEDYEKNISFLSIMKENLANLKTGLECNE